MLELAEPGDSRPSDVTSGLEAERWAFEDNHRPLQSDVHASGEMGCSGR